MKNGNPALLRRHEVEMWTQALCLFLFLSAVDRLEEWMDALCLHFHYSSLCCPSSRKWLSKFQPSTFASLPSPESGHTGTKSRQFPTWGPVAQESKQLSSVSAHYNSQRQPVLKCSSFIMSWRLESASYLTPTRLHRCHATSNGV